MASNNKLKAYVRFDGSGRIVPGSLILQKSKPKVGNWKQIRANECCNSPATDSAILLENGNVLITENNNNIII